MNRFVFAVTLSFLLLGAPQAQQAGSSNASIIMFPVNNSWSHTISLESAYIAESYVSNALGQQYFEQYTSLYGGASYGNVSYVYFSYNVPFANGTSRGDGSRLLGITVTVDNGNVVGYVGPQKPYVVSVNATQAAESAEGYGFRNATATLTGVFNSSNLTSFSYYSVLWSIASNSLNNNAYNAGYINVDDGKMIGEYLSNSTLISRIGSEGYGVISNLTVPNITLQGSGNALIQGIETPNVLYIAIAFVIAVVLAVVALKMSRKD